MKSLDHRSFFFKEAHKKYLHGKKQVEELRKIQNIKNKTINQLKGGSLTSEFYSTYQSF